MCQRASGAAKRKLPTGKFHDVSIVQEYEAFKKRAVSPSVHRRCRLPGGLRARFAVKPKTGDLK